MMIMMITNSLAAKNSTQNHNKNSCGENRKIHIDLIVQQFLMFGPNGRKFPETMSQLPKFCRCVNSPLLIVSIFFLFLN